MSPEVAEEIRVRGTVQGVGFRPTVYRLAKACGLKGEVWNDGEGVLIRAVAPSAVLEQFTQQLQQDCPPLATIEAIDRMRLSIAPDYADFSIAPSLTGTIHTQLPADAATCPECRAEIFDPLSRWYRYPFTNCTHCGPRLSIIQAIPYDRHNTSMAEFGLCPDCQQAYDNIQDRRFHAQPVACHRCGPRAWLERSDGKPIVSDMFSMMDDVDAACTLLQRGEIVAIKGLGGFHLACDATNETTVQQLRHRKHRDHKPFALMARDLEIIERYCELNDTERQLLTSAAAPIVLLKRKLSPDFPETAPASFGNSRVHRPLASSVAPHLSTLGFMLPYTPLHHLMLRRMTRPIVLTSGNLSDYPQCIDNQEAQEQLGQVATYFLLHNRPIVNRVDDSVVRVIQSADADDADQIQMLRRARGYAPAPIRLPAGFESMPPILAMGSELKNTICLLQSGQAILSQHLGDLENAAAFQAYGQTIDLYRDLFEHQPAAIAVDGHPDYLSRKLGLELAETAQVSVYVVQHHHAHVAACLAENGVSLETDPVLGIALDGLGFGSDGNLWGGEFLLADYRQSQRLASLQPVAMLGGTQAIYQPWRNTYALLQFLNHQPRRLLDQMLSKGLNSPLASSCGRLFDAVAAAVGLCREHASYEGQGAIELEALIEPEHLEQAQSSAYPFEVDAGSKLLRLNARPLWQVLLQDLQRQTDPGLMAARFHVGLAAALVQIVQQLRPQHAFTQVALTGGVFQNAVLLEQVRQRLAVQNLTVFCHHQVPANDGGLSLGQATIAAARMQFKDQVKSLIHTINSV
jgi:hydrogenase maturation protein HypF